MEKRHCLVRRAGASSVIEPLLAYYVGGVQCAEPLRGNSIATEMMFRLLSESFDEPMPFAKVCDPKDRFLPYASVRMS